MSKKDKLIKRIKQIPKDFTYQELNQLLGLLGFIESNKGKTSGSRVSFAKDSLKLLLHKPHDGHPIVTKALKDIVEFLEREKLI